MLAKYPCMCARLLQPCPILGDPTDYSPPGSSVHGILWARILGGMAYPSPGDLRDPGSNSSLLHFLQWQTGSLSLAPPGKLLYPSTQIISVAQSCLTLCNPMDCSTPSLPVHHQLPEFTQTHVHWVSDAIQPSHPLSSPSPTFNLSQHQGLNKWVSS